MLCKGFWAAGCEEFQQRASLLGLAAGRVGLAGTLGAERVVDSPALLAFAGEQQGLGSHSGQCLGLLCWGLLHSLGVQACAWGGAGNSSSDPNVPVPSRRSSVSSHLLGTWFSIISCIPHPCGMALHTWWACQLTAAHPTS